MTPPPTLQPAVLGPYRVEWERDRRALAQEVSSERRAITGGERAAPAPERPQQTARDAERYGDPIAPKARLLARAARARGWDVVLTYARGTLVNGPRSEPRLQESVAVRCWRFPGERVVALWARRLEPCSEIGPSLIPAPWKPDSGWAWVDGDGPAVDVGVTECLRRVKA